MYEVKIVADSLNPVGVRLTTITLRYWRAIHAEFLTHRVFSRNASSSRAIPVATMLKQVWNDPAGPLHWGVNQPGMQARAQLVGWKRAAAGALWRGAAKVACGFAWGLMKLGTHKQVANRLLEPFQYITVLVTSTEWDNFFILRDDAGAQPEIRQLAIQMKQAMADSRPRQLKEGEWHLPFVHASEDATLPLKVLLKLSTARNARVSYLTHDRKDPSITADTKLHDRLVVAKPIHASPAEHVAQALPHDAFVRNFRGWRQYRDLLEASV